MSNEALESKLIKRTADTLRMARKVIEAMNDDKDGEGFQEEPSLSDLVLVAQIIGQTSTINHLEGIHAPQQTDFERPSAPPAEQSLGALIAVGAPMMPDLTVLWTPDGWWIHSHPEFKLEPICCESLESLTAALQQLAGICAQHRIPPPLPQELA